MEFVDPIHIERGKHPSYGKEARGDWLFRLLGIDHKTDDGQFWLHSIDENHACVLLSSSSGRTFERGPFSHGRIEALLSWSASVINGSRDASNRGAFVIITDASRSRFLLQRKDNLHPRPDCREQISLIGGGLPAEVDARPELIRELYEELRDPRYADEVSAHLDMQEDVTVHAFQRAFHVSWAIAQAPSERIFQQWMTWHLAPQGLSEAFPCFLDRAALHVLLNQHATFPVFFAEVNQLLDRMIS